MRVQQRRWFILLALVIVGVGGVALRFGSPKTAPDPKPAANYSVFPAAPSGGCVYPFRRVIALVIGINSYPQMTGTSDLSYAEADAEAVGDVFARNYGYDVVRLIGPTATKAAVEDTIRKYGEELNELEALIVYFAGHGQSIELPGHSEAGYLIPADASLDMNNRTDETRWSEQAIGMERLTDMMEKVKAQHVLFIADACRSGFMIPRGTLERWDLKTAIYGKSRMVLTSTTRRQLARENQAEKHGYFTAKLLNELRKNDAASVLDIYYPLSRSVPAVTGGNMTPQFAQTGTGEGMFVFIPNSIPKDERENDLNGAFGDKGLAGVGKRILLHAKQMSTYNEFLSVFHATDYHSTEGLEERKRDWEQKFERFRRNALAGDLWAMASLCICYEKGLGVERDPKLAFHWARQADRLPKPAGVGRYLLGRCYQNKSAVPLSGRAAEIQAKQYFSESAISGFGPGRWAAAREILRDQPDRAGIRAATHFLEQAVSDGVLAANIDLAFLILEGGIDRERPLLLLNAAAERDYPNAHYHLFYLFSEGKPAYPPKDLKRAEEHLRRAAELGSEYAMFELGNELGGQTNALKLPVDYKQAFVYLDRAAQQNYPPGLVQTARFLALGLGGPIDAVEAKIRLEKAVQLGYPVADQIQGDWYLAGKVYPQSDASALEAYIRGADRGNPNCCFETGKLILEGRGFKARNGRKDGSYHDDWYRGLHYFVMAFKDGTLGPQAGKSIEGTINNFVELLEGGLLSVDIDRHMREMERGVWDETLQKRAGGKNGGPGERRLIQFKENGALMVSLNGEYIPRATELAAKWRSEHPDSFHFFCEKWSVDSKTLKINLNVQKKGGGDK